MFFALVSLNVMHPGRALVGPESELNSRKERKLAAKREKEQSGGSNEVVVVV